MNSETGKWLIIGGLGIAAVGLLIYFFHDKLHWFGNLPGDIRSEGENYKFYFPITSMIIVSVVISLVLYLIRKFQ
jgi:hypothetical protein